MYYQMTAFRFSLRDQLCRTRMWAVILLIPILAVAVRFLMPPMDRTAVACVGVVLPEDGAEDFWSRIALRSGQTVEFVLTDEETLLQNVAVSRWDCGLILKDEFDAMLREGDLKRGITLVTGPGSTVYPLVRETVAAVLSEMISPVIAKEYLLQSGIVPEEETAAIEELIEKNFADIKRVDVVAQTMDGEEMNALQLMQNTLEQVLPGTLSVILMVWILYTAIDLSWQYQSPAIQRMCPLRSAAELLLPRLAAMLLPVFVASALTLAAIFGFDGMHFILMLLPYLSALGALALFLAVWRKTKDILPVLVPFAAAACFILCPILLDVTSLFPQLGFLSRWMPPTLYLRSCKGDGMAVAALLGAALILGCAVVILPKCGKKQNN